MRIIHLKDIEPCTQLSIANCHPRAQQLFVQGLLFWLQEQSEFAGMIRTSIEVTGFVPRWRDLSPKLCCRLQQPHSHDSPSQCGISSLPIHRPTMNLPADVPPCVPVLSNDHTKVSLFWPSCHSSNCWPSFQQLFNIGSRVRMSHHYLLPAFLSTEYGKRFSNARQWYLARNSSFHFLQIFMKP